MAAQPALFVSHGSPMIMLEPSPARDFLSGLGASLARPDAILVISAHHDRRGAVISTAEAPETIHDFGGFPRALFEMRYPAPGAPALAEDVAELLETAGVAVERDPEGGLDHGAWVPLTLGWPAADIPVTQLSISSAHPPEWHYRLGEALRPLRARNVLIIGSGSLTHNLRAIFAEGRDHDAATPDWVSAFTDWIKARFDAGDSEAVLRALSRAPHARENHPTPDHILPLFAAMGAGGPDVKRLHHSYTYGVLAMDAYAFG